MYFMALLLHLTFATLTGVAVVYAGITLATKQSRSYRATALVLGILATLEMVSGAVLAILSVRISAPSLCANIVLYLGIVFLTEVSLFVGMKRVSITFPLTKTISPVVASISFYLAALLLGF